VRSIGIKIILGLLILGLIGAMAIYLPEGIDWHQVFRPAALSLISGKNPYQVEGFYHALWILFPLVPLAVLPEAVGRAAMVVLGIAAMAYTARRLGASRLATVFLLLSPPALHCHLSGTVDWLIVLGFVLPPKLGLFFLTAKPQMGIAVAVFWAIEAWRDGRWRGLFDLLLPITVALGLSFLFYGWWFLEGLNAPSYWWNASLFPVSIPVGLGLLVAAVQKRQVEYAMAASPCLSPYVLLHSWIGALLAVVSNTPVLIASVVGLWVAVLM